MHKGSKPVFANFRENEVKDFSTLKPLFYVLDRCYDKYFLYLQVCLVVALQNNEILQINAILFLRKLF